MLLLTWTKLWVGQELWFCFCLNHNIYSPESRQWRLRFEQQTNECTCSCCSHLVQPLLPAVLTFDHQLDAVGQRGEDARRGGFEGDCLPLEVDAVHGFGTRRRKHWQGEKRRKFLKQDEFKMKIISSLALELQISGTNVNAMNALNVFWFRLDQSNSITPSDELTFLFAAVIVVIKLTLSFRLGWKVVLVLLHF